MIVLLGLAVSLFVFEVAGGGSDALALSAGVLALSVAAAWYSRVRAG